MKTRRLPLLLACATAMLLPAHAAGPADPLAAVDLNRPSLIADIVGGFEATWTSLSPDERAAARLALTKRLASLRADRLLAASLATSAAGLEAVLAEDERRASRPLVPTAKALGDANRDLLYTPITPCRLIDTRGFGAPIQGGAFTPGERRAYVPAGACALPASGVNSIVVSFSTQNLTPQSGGVLALLAPGAPVTAIVDVFNLGAEWSASNTVVKAGTAAQFDAVVQNANAHLVVDVLGYFAPPAAGSVGTAQIADGAVTAAKLASNGCTGGQALIFNGTSWVCGTQVPAIQACPGGMTKADSQFSTLCFATGPTGTWEQSAAYCEATFHAPLCTLGQWRAAICSAGLVNPGRAWTSQPAGTATFATVAACTGDGVGTAIYTTATNRAACCLEWPKY